MFKALVSGLKKGMKGNAVLGILRTRYDLNARPDEVAWFVDRYAQLFSADDIAVLYLVDQAVAANPSKPEHCERIRRYETAALAEQTKGRVTADTLVLLQREAMRFAPNIAPDGGKGPAAAAERQRKFAHLVTDDPQVQSESDRQLRAMLQATGDDKIRHIKVQED
ncbi:hypothetical protein ACSFA0_23355 [Variovorax sp. LT1P1]|uniref:hypothetical protein n=1 Tax=Variovorax sp. LT1P1 TaxID=3443730 RepID=UPI003F44A187